MFCVLNCVSPELQQRIFWLSWDRKFPPSSWFTIILFIIVLPLRGEPRKAMGKLAGQANSGSPKIFFEKSWNRSISRYSLVFSMKQHYLSTRWTKSERSFFSLTVPLAKLGNFLLFRRTDKVAVFLDVDVERWRMGNGPLWLLKAKVKPQHDCTDADVGPANIFWKLKKIPRKVKIVQIGLYVPWIRQ